MLKLKSVKSQIGINVFDYETLVKETILTSTKLMEYFKMNLIYYQLISGKGLEFEKIREYAVGDDPRRIDWEKFSKTQKLYIRAFKEERRFDIIIVMDVADSMLLGTAEYTKTQFASIIAGAIAFAANEAGDQSAVVMHSDKVSVAMDPSNDFYNLLKIISEKENYGGKKDWVKLSRDLVANYSSDSIIFIISDFIDTNPEVFIPELASYFSKVYGVMIRDPIDNELPSGVGRTYLKDVAGTETHLVDLDKVKAEYRMLNKRIIEHVKDEFHEYGQLFFEVNTTEDFGISFIKALGAEEVVIY